MVIAEKLWQLILDGIATITIADSTGGVSITAPAENHGPATVQSIGYQYYDNLVHYLGEVELHSIKIGPDEANEYIKMALGNSFYHFGWTKDDKVVLVHAKSLIPNITEAAKKYIADNSDVTKLHAWNAVKADVFQRAIEVEATLAKGGHKAGKRLSGDEGTPWLAGHSLRMATPPRIMWVDWLTNVEEDGGGIIMSRMADRIIDQENVNAPGWKAQEHRNRIKDAGSFEVRMRVPASISEDEFGVKWKGDLIRRSAVADPTGKIITSRDCDFILPSDSAKKEVKYTGADFWIGIRPRHWKDRCWLDIQSTIDLHEVINNDYILETVKDYAREYLVALRYGEITPSPADNIHTEEKFDKLSDWVQGEYFASKGQTMWFASMVRRVGGTFLTHLTNTVSEKFSLPIVGGRFYMCSDRLHGKKVEPGQIFLDTASSRAVISHEEIGAVFAVMGGGDSDDALQLPMFIDKDTGKIMVIAHRQPNTYGEYWLFELAKGSWQAENLPTWDGKLVPVRIDLQERKFGTLDPGEKGSNVNFPEYKLDNLLPFINRSIANIGTLGTCVLAMEEEISNGLTPTFPYPMEEIVDGPVQHGWDATPAKEAARHLNKELLDVPTSNYFIRRKAEAKLAALIELGRVTKEVADNLGREMPTNNPAKARKDAVVAFVHEHSLVEADHWLDVLISGIADIAVMFQEGLDMVASLASPPIELYLTGARYAEEGSNLRRQFGRILNLHKSEDGEIAKESWDDIIADMDSFMSKYSEDVQRKMLLGAARNAYIDSGNEKGYASDGVLFIGNNGAKFLKALRTVPMGNGTMLKHIAWVDDKIVVEEGEAQEDEQEERVLAQTRPIAMTMAWYKVGVSAGKLPDDPQSVTKDQKIHWHNAIERNVTKLIGQTCVIVANEERSEVVLTNGTCIGNVAPKRREHFPVGCSFTIGDITAKGGNYYAVAVM